MDGVSKKYGMRGKIPTAWSIQKILTRTQYCGFNTFLGEIYKGNYESIIDVETLTEYLHC